GLVGVFLFTACGSYYNGQMDGIYAPRGASRAQENARYQRAYVQDETNEYEEYFATQNAQIERAQQVMTGDYEDSVFTDVDDYESISPQQSQAYSYSNSNGSWGSQPTNVSINYYSTGGYYSNPYL